MFQRSEGQSWNWITVKPKLEADVELILLASNVLPFLLQACKAGVTKFDSSHPKTTSYGNRMFTSQGLPKGLQTVAASKDNSRQWSEKRTYIRFVDSFRLRTEDEYTFRGDLSGLYAQEDPMPCFKRYLKKAKAKGLMPGEKQRLSDYTRNIGDPKTLSISHKHSQQAAAFS